MGAKKVRNLKTSVGGSDALAEKARWTRLNYGVIQAGGGQRGRHSVGRLGPRETAGTQQDSSKNDSCLEF